MLSFWIFDAYSFTSQQVPLWVSDKIFPFKKNPIYHTFDLVLVDLSSFINLMAIF